MKTRSHATFKYHVRARGSQVEGPIRFAIGQTVLGKMMVERKRALLAEESAVESIA